MTTEPSANAAPEPPGSEAEAAMRTLWADIARDNAVDNGATLKASPDLAATLVDGDATATLDGSSTASSSSSSSSSSTTSVFHYKENTSVVLRRSQLAGLAGGSVVRDGSADAVGDDGCDFVVKRRLGHGGMGVVYVARQISLNRDVAIKMVLPGSGDGPAMANKLISEALVTGGLEHPGIVPVHELAHADDSTLFYAMKVVRGVPWSARLPSLPERENIDILLRVADAVAFAHDKGILHRDIKPENVMLGDYGEVLLLDWGLAVSLDPESRAETLSPGNAKAGTAGYMAPEMALGLAEAIGPASDIYLLGAVLFEILTGSKPHTGANIFICLAAAADNFIRATDRADPLMEVARRAMMDRPEDRYPSVKAFQDALRDVLHNLESVTLARSAREDLDKAVRTLDYETFSRSIFAFHEARRMWPGNADAVAGEAEARCRYAECALGKGDYDLAGSAVGDVDDPRAAALRERIDRARRDVARRRRLVAVLAAAVILVSVAGAAVFLWQHDREEKALAAMAAAEEEVRREVMDRRRFDTFTAYVRNRDFIAQQDRELELIGVLSGLRRTALAAAKRKPGDPLPREAEMIMARLAREDRALSRNRDWGFDPATAARLRADAASAMGGPEELTLDLDGTALSLSLIPGGRFVMGRLTNYGLEGEADEYPHLVKLSEPFYLGTTEVTRGMWRAALGVERREDVETFFYSRAFADEISEEDFENAEWAKWGWRTLPLGPGEADLPATGVSWSEIHNLFLPALRDKVPAGWQPALPTEAEWEYACRAGDPAPFHGGESEETLAGIGWYKGSNVDGPRPVAGLKPNAWGLYDMHGNAAELVRDSYTAAYYLTSPVDDPLCAAEEYFFVMRGGTWQFPPEHCSSSYRDYLYRDSRIANTGFRLALIPAGRQVPPIGGAKPRELLIPMF